MSKPQILTQLCWHCDAVIARDATHCPYCGGSLEKQETSIPKVEGSPYIKEALNAPIPPITIENRKSNTYSIGLFSIQAGSFLILWSLTLLFMSDEGQFTRVWEADRWPLYLIAGLGLIGFSLKGLFPKIR